jgi:hypothetical protein
MTDYEKLGAFYLGKTVDPETSDVRDELLLYDSKDLTTHAVCVGMTGSGKTGLCVSLLEEAAIDGIPAIAIDPKGDLGNLMLTFPELSPADFRPWVDVGEAARNGKTPEQQAKWTAELWRKGLSEWHQDGSRISRLREAVDVSIYTPGGSAGLPLAVLRSFAAPSAELAADADGLRERILSAVSGVLSLIGVEADPVRSREHILLSAILEHSWKEGRDLDIAALIRVIQKPPFESLGVLDLESFFPAKERFQLAMLLNNLIASPAFSAWQTGEPLDVGRLLHTPEGRPRLSIVSIAHLSEQERMFFVTLLLNEVVSWVRAQPGTNSLRALLYMDEVFGFFPPSAEPPSKRPMLTLLKQARAHGLGVVLATQNPVDLDYKGLSNAGTWFLGRLQTERDKARVIEGLEGASIASGSGFDRAQMERILAGLDSRVFLMNNVHDDEPVLFHTRWALSYLRGPLTRDQIAELMRERKTATASVAETSPRPVAAPLAPVEEKSSDSSRPIVPPKVDEQFVAALGGSGQLVYRPSLLGVASLHYANARAKVDRWENLALMTDLRGDEATRAPWKAARLLEDGAPEVDDEPGLNARFVALPAAAADPKTYVRWAKMLKSHLYREHPLDLWRCRELKEISNPGESEGDFRVRLRQLLHERRDLEIEKLRKRFAPKLARIQERIRRAEARVAKEQSQYQQQKMQTAVSLGATVLGAIFGRKLTSVGNVGRATTAARGAGRAARERGDIARAQESVEALSNQLAELEREFEESLENARTDVDDTALELEELAIRPKKADISIERVVLTWTPWCVSQEGIAEPDF